MPDQHLATISFTDGVRRLVWEELKGRQYVLDDDGREVRGVWIV